MIVGTVEFHGCNHPVFNLRMSFDEGGSIRLHFGAMALVCCQYKNAETTGILACRVLFVIILQ